MKTTSVLGMILLIGLILPQPGGSPAQDGVKKSEGQQVIEDLAKKAKAQFLNGKGVAQLEAIGLLADAADELHSQSKSFLVNATKNRNAAVRKQALTAMWKIGDQGPFYEFSFCALR